MQCNWTATYLLLIAMLLDMFLILVFGDPMSPAPSESPVMFATFIFVPQPEVGVNREDKRIKPSSKAKKTTCKQPNGLSNKQHTVVQG